MASFSLKKAAKASCMRAILPPLHTRGKQIFPSSASLRRGRRGCVKLPPPRPLVAPAWQARRAAASATTVAKSRGGFDEYTPTQGSAMATSCGEPTLSPQLPLRGLSPPPLHAVPPPYHPATLLLPIRMIPKKIFCPISGVNLMILPIP